jgi:hypothetical protein
MKTERQKMHDEVAFTAPGKEFRIDEGCVISLQRPSERPDEPFVRSRDDRQYQYGTRCSTQHPSKR